MTHSTNRDSWGSKWGFILACIGSAVGMGNIWLFPARISKYGGATFLIPYLIFVVIIGSTGVIGEMAFGRATRSGPIHAFGQATQMRLGSERPGKLLGLIPVLGSLAMAIGYSVVTGWIFKYTAQSFSGALSALEGVEAFDANFGATAAGNTLWQLAAMGVTIAIMVFGVGRGIEKANKIMTPLFYVLFLALAVWVATLSGAGEGYRFLLVPDWSKLLEPYTWVMAMGQAFFSLSITGSGMIVYGAYLDKNADIPKASIRTAIFDTMAAVLAALAIMPAVFAYDLDVARGPSLMFVTLPTVFQQMPMGQLFAVFFFVSVMFAGLTSLINMFEAVAESWQSHFKLGRKTAVLICTVLTLGVGIFMESEARVGAWMDFITIVVVPIGAVMGAVSVYYILGWSKLRKELECGRTKPLSPLFGPVGKYVYVPLTILVVILGFVFKGIG